MKINNNKIAFILPLLVAVVVITAYGSINTVLAANNTTQTATVNVKPVIGISDAATLTFPDVIDSTTGDTPESIVNTITDQSNMAIDLYTRANQTNMTANGTTDTINIGFTSNSAANNLYTTNYQSAYTNWLKPGQGSKSANTWNEPLNITVPQYTNNGTYTITIYHAAVANGAAAPTQP